MAESMHEKIAQLENYIMKKCLWQFHSRTWDRKRQNERILGMTKQLLLGEPVATDTPEERCYWVDAVTMAEAFRARCPWLAEMSEEEIAMEEAGTERNARGRESAGERGAADSRHGNLGKNRACRVHGRGVARRCGAGGCGGPV